MRGYKKFDFHKHTLVLLLQRTIPQPAGDASLPRSDPNISIPDKGEPHLSVHNFALLSPIHTHSCRSHCGWKVFFVKHSGDYLAWFDGSWQLNFLIQSQFLAAAIVVTDSPKCVNTAVITIQIYVRIFSHLSTWNLSETWISCHVGAEAGLDSQEQLFFPSVLGFTE